MPIIEDETSKNLIIAFGVANKLCKKCQKFGSNHSGKCTSNFDVAKPIGNAERLLSAKLSEEMATASTNPLLCARVFRRMTAVNGYWAFKKDCKPRAIRLKSKKRTA